MRIYIVGMMGVGKSTIGKKMASIMGYRFIDLDKIIEENESKTVNEIFETYGEKYFREKETEQLYLLNEDNIIIATGGGTPCYNNNMQFIKDNGLSIYLKAKMGLIIQRISHHQDKRPLLKGMKMDELRLFVDQKMIEREPFYRQSNHIFNIPESSAETIVKSIL